MNQSSEQMRKLNYMTSEIEELYHQAAVQAGIADSVHVILYVLCAKDYACLQSEIYKESGVSRKTINSAIKGLEKDGMLTLTQGKGRNTVVSLTEKGIAFAREKVEPLNEIENEIFTEWPLSEVEMYLHLTAKYRDALRTKLEAYYAKARSSADQT